MYNRSDFMKTNDDYYDNLISLLTDKERIRKALANYGDDDASKEQFINMLRDILDFTELVKRATDRQALEECIQLSGKTGADVEESQNKDDIGRNLAEISDEHELTIEEKRIEVEKRKQLLGIEGPLYTVEGMTKREPTEEELQAVKEFENKSGNVVYLIIVSSGDLLNLLFIPKTKGDLQIQNNMMKNYGIQWQYAYVIDRACPLFSEIGYVELFIHPLSNGILPRIG